MTKPCVLGLPAMKLLVLADDDSVRHNIQTERADLVVSCGDIYESIILQVAQSIQCPRILAVKGNHDSGEPFPPPIVDLHLTIHTVDGVRFGGFQGSWRYKQRRASQQRPELAQPAHGARADVHGPRCAAHDSADAAVARKPDRHA